MRRSWAGGVLFAFLACACDCKEGTESGKEGTQAETRSSASAKTPASEQEFAKTGPGDPTLSFKLVSQKPEAYIGKRGTWQGRFSGKQGSGKTTRVSYIGNLGEAKTASDFRSFVVEHDCGFSEAPSDSGIITGTIVAVIEIDKQIGGPGGPMRTETEKVPLLKFATIEKE